MINSCHQALRLILSECVLGITGLINIVIAHPLACGPWTGSAEVARIYLQFDATKSLKNEYLLPIRSRCDETERKLRRSRRRRKIYAASERLRYAKFVPQLFVPGTYTPNPRENIHSPQLNLQFFTTLRVREAENRIFWRRRTNKLELSAKQTGTADWSTRLYLYLQLSLPLMRAVGCLPHK